MELTSDLLKILLPALLVLFGIYYVVQLLLTKQFEEKKEETKQKNQEVILPLRLQAYERLILFLERITPNNLLLRLQDNGILVADFQQLILKETREEFNHNIAQQLYISHESWLKLVDAKEKVISLVNQSAATLPLDAPAIELSKKIIENSLLNEIQPTADALKSIKAEAQALF